jgi:hypothetical protein
MVSWHRERRAEEACGWHLPPGMAVVARGSGAEGGGFGPAGRNGGEAASGDGDIRTVARHACGSHMERAC